MLTLQEVKQYLRIFYPEEDYFLLLCIDAAEEFIRHSVDDYDTKKSNVKFQNHVKMLMFKIINNEYDDRTLVEKESKTYNVMFHGMLTQLQFGEWS